MRRIIKISWETALHLNANANNAPGNKRCWVMPMKGVWWHKKE